MKKLSVALSLRERLEKSFQNGLEDVFGKFKVKQGLFRGERRTYNSLPDFADEPSKRGFKNVGSTVKEQLDWLKDNSKDFFDITFSIEKTNANNLANAELLVEGVSWGTFSTLELLRLKSILDGKLKGLVAEIPVRTEEVIWNSTKEEAYHGRVIFETPLESGFAKTTLKQQQILHDPHAGGTTIRPPVLGETSTQVNIGEYTSQIFTGEASIRERAQMLVRYEKLYQAVIDALATANNVEILQSNLGSKILDFIFDGK